MSQRLRIEDAPKHSDPSRIRKLAV